MVIYDEQDAMKLSNDDLLFYLKNGCFDERELCDCEVRRRLEEWSLNEWRWKNK